MLPDLSLPPWTETEHLDSANMDCYMRKRREKRERLKTEKTPRKLKRRARWHMYREHFSSQRNQQGWREAGIWEEDYASLCTFCPFRSGIRGEAKGLIQHSLKFILMGLGVY